jgi:PAS domain S-box-containing protein
MKFYNKKYKEIRKAKGISIEEITMALNRTRKTFWTWEKGSVQPGVSEVYLLAGLVGVSVAEISDLRDNSNLLDSSVKFDADNFSDCTEEIKNYIYGLRKQLLSVNKENRILKNKCKLLSENLDNQQSFIYVKDCKHSLIYLNKAFSLFLDKTENDLLGKKFSNIFQMKEFADILEFEKKVFLTGEQVSNIEVAVPGTKNRMHGFMNISPIFGNGGQVEWITVSILDVTNKRKEEEIKGYLEKISNFSNDGIWILQLDPEYKFVFVNDKVKDLWGFSLENLKKNISEWIYENNLRCAKGYKSHKSAFISKEVYRNFDPHTGLRYIEDLRDIFYLKDKTVAYGILKEVTPYYNSENKRD